jgi:hypothetical protein
MQKMKPLLLFCLIITFLACNPGIEDTSEILNADSGQVNPDELQSDYSNDPARIDTVPVKKLSPTDSFDYLISKISEIRELPFRHTEMTKDWKIVSTADSCGDPLYWKIAGMGKAIVPALINKVLDSTKSGIKIRCSGEFLNNGTIAFMILDEITNVPYALAFNTQLCTFTINCNFGYPDFVLQMVNEQPAKVHTDLVNWYLKYEQDFRRTAIEERTDCEKKYNIRYRWKGDYSKP